jgi:hypothetical protein
MRKLNRAVGSAPEEDVLSSWALCTLVSGSNIKLDQPFQIKREIEFGRRFKVTRYVAVVYISLETHPIIVPFWHCGVDSGGVLGTEAVPRILKADYLFMGKQEFAPLRRRVSNSSLMASAFDLLPRRLLSRAVAPKALGLNDPF